MKDSRSWKSERKVWKVILPNKAIIGVHAADRTTARNIVADAKKMDMDRTSVSITPSNLPLPAYSELWEQTTAKGKYRQLR